MAKKASERKVAVRAVRDVVKAMLQDVPVKKPRSARASPAPGILMNPKEHPPRGAPAKRPRKKKRIWTVLVQGGSPGLGKGH